MWEIEREALITLRFDPLDSQKIKIIDLAFFDLFAGWFWAVKDGEVYILQARAITTLNKDSLDKYEENAVSQYIKGKVHARLLGLYWRKCLLRTELLIFAIWKR